MSVSVSVSVSLCPTSTSIYSKCSQDAYTAVYLETMATGRSDAPPPCEPPSEVRTEAETWALLALLGLCSFAPRTSGRLLASFPSLVYIQCVMVIAGVSE